MDIIIFLYLRRFLRFISAALSQSIPFKRDACQLSTCRHRVANRADTSGAVAGEWLAIWKGSHYCVDTVTWVRAGRYGIRIPVEARDSSLFQDVHTGSRDQPASYLMGTGVLPRGWVGRGLEVDHLPLTGAKVKEECLRHTSPRPVCLHCVDREWFPFTLLLW
jgi:hypothetical protein